MQRNPEAAPSALGFTLPDEYGLVHGGETIFMWQENAHECATRWMRGYGRLLRPGDR